MSCLTTALALAVMILMPVVFGMDDDTATNDESTSELLCAAAAAASLVLRRRMLKTVLKRIRDKLAKTSCSGGLSLQPNRRRLAP